MSQFSWQRSWLRHAIVILVAAKVAGLILLFDLTGSEFELFDLVKSVYSRSLEWFLIGLLLLAIASFGLQVIPRTRLHLLVTALVLVTAISAAFASEPEIALYGTTGRYLGLTFVVDMAVLYLAIAVAFRTPRDWSVFLGVTALAVAATLVYAYVQYAGLDPLPWTRSLLTRPFSTIGNPDMYGHLLSVALGAGASAAVIGIGPAQRVPRAVAVGLCLAVLVGIAFVATRASFLGILATLVTIPLLYLAVHGQTRSALLRVGVGMGAAVIAVAVGLFMSPIGARLAATLAGVATRDRILTWQGAAEAFLARPLFGWGPDSVGVAWPHVRPAEFAQVAGLGFTVDSAHDWLLQAAVTTGVLGVIAVVGAVACFSWSLVRTGLQRSPALAALLTAAAAAYWSHALVSPGSIGVDWVPWAVFGGTVAMLETGGDPVRGRPLLRPLVVVVVALGAIASLAGMRELQANAELLRAYKDIGLGQPASAIDHAKQAVALDPGRATYWNELGRAYYAAGRWADAASTFGEAARHAPHEATFLSNEGRALAQIVVGGDSSKGAADAALSAAEAGAMIDPNEPTAQVALAQVAVAVDRAGVALRAAVDAIRLYRGDPSYDALAISAASKVTDAAFARTELQRALSYKETSTLWVALAAADLRVGDKQAALADAQRALRLDPFNAEARSVLRSAGG